MEVFMTLILIGVFVAVCVLLMWEVRTLFLQRQYGWATGLCSILASLFLCTFIFMFCVVL